MKFSPSERLQKVLDEIVAFEKAAADKTTETPVEVMEASGAAWRSLRGALQELIVVVSAAEDVIDTGFVGDDLLPALADLEWKLIR